MPEMDAREPDVGTGEGRARNRRQLVRESTGCAEQCMGTLAEKPDDARFEDPSREIHKPTPEIASEHDLLKVKNYCFDSREATHLKHAEV